MGVTRKCYEFSHGGTRKCYEFSHGGTRKCYEFSHGGTRNYNELPPTRNCSRWRVARFWRAVANARQRSPPSSGRWLASLRHQPPSSVVIIVRPAGASSRFSSDAPSIRKSRWTRLCAGWRAHAFFLSADSSHGGVPSMPGGQAFFFLL